MVDAKRPRLAVRFLKVAGFVAGEVGIAGVAIFGAMAYAMTVLRRPASGWAALWNLVTSGRDRLALLGMFVAWCLVACAVAVAFFTRWLPGGAKGVFTEAIGGQRRRPDLADRLWLYFRILLFAGLAVLLVRTVYLDWRR